MHFFQRHAAWKASLGELHIPPKCIINSGGAANPASGWANAFYFPGEYQPLDFLLDLIVQFVAIVSKEFYPVILIRIVRCGENNAGIGSQRTSDVGHAGRG